MATPEQSRPPRTGPAADSHARPVPEPSREPVGTEPEENRPGHHPDVEQDQPPLDDFAAKFGIPPESPADEGDGQPDEAGAPSPASPSPGTPSSGTTSSGTGRPTETSGGGSDDEAGSDAGPDCHGGRLPRQVRTVWVVAARRGVLPALGGLRSVTDALERIVRRTI